MHTLIHLNFSKPAPWWVDYKESKEYMDTYANRMYLLMQETIVPLMVRNTRNQNCGTTSGAKQIPVLRWMLRTTFNIDWCSSSTVDETVTLNINKNQIPTNHTHNLHAEIIAVSKNNTTEEVLGDPGIYIVNTATTMNSLGSAYGMTKVEKHNNPSTAISNVQPSALKTHLWWLATKMTRKYSHTYRSYLYHSST